MLNTTLLSAQQSTAGPTDPITERVRSTWMLGDFGRVAVGYASGAADFIARLELTHGERVLDVACGTGNLALPAARAGTLTTGIDIAPNLVAQARALAAIEGLSIGFELGDAEALPYADASFDTVVSMFGVMFAPRAERSSAELLRVTRTGGRIALANWTSTGFIGQMLRVVVGYLPPPPGTASVLQWGDEATVRKLLSGVAAVHFVRRRITFNYPCTPEATVRLFREWYGPTVRAFAALDNTKGASLEAELVSLWNEHNRGGSDATRVESEYLETIAIR